MIWIYSENKLVRLREGTFRNMMIQSYLILRDNEIAQIDEGAFENVIANQIYLEKNPICHIKVSYFQLNNKTQI